MSRHVAANGARLLSLMVLVVVGCGAGGPELGEVSGIVTLDGKPVPNAFVTFAPEAAGRPSQAKTDEEGRYKLQFSPSREGALLGHHDVRVSTQDIDDAGRSLPERIPEQYHAQGSIPVTIREGANEINLELTTTPP